MEQILKKMFNFDVAEEDVEYTDSDSVCNEDNWRIKQVKKQ